MPVGVIVADANGNLISTNAAALETLGSPVSGTVDRPERAYVPCLPDGSPLPPDYAPLPRAVKYGEITTGREMLIRRADGAERVVIVAAAPVRDADGKITAAVSTIQDITEHRHLEDRIAWLASFPELNPNPVTEVDAAGELHYVNPAARRLFPDLSETGMRHPWLAGLGAVRERLSSGREPFIDIEVAVGGSFFQQTLQYVPASRTFRIYGLDITIRKHAESERERLLAENRLQREFLEQLVASASVGIAVVSGPERRYDLANPCYEGMVGSEAGALTGRTIAQVLTHPSDRAIIDLVEAAIATGRTTGTRDYAGACGARPRAELLGYLVRAAVDRRGQGRQRAHPGPRHHGPVPGREARQRVSPGPAAAARHPGCRHGQHEDDDGLPGPPVQLSARQFRLRQWLRP